MRVQHRADPQRVSWPALRCEECDPSLACRRQLDRRVPWVKGELTEYLQRELFCPPLIVEPGPAEVMRSALPVFASSRRHRLLASVRPVDLRGPADRVVDRLGAARRARDPPCPDPASARCGNPGKGVGPPPGKTIG